MWGVDSPLMLQLPSVAMLGAALMLRRSLGSWPVLLAAAILAIAVQAGRQAAGLAPAYFYPAWAMVVPALLFLLARRQIVPGLRRGQMSDVERQRWILQHAIVESTALERYQPSARS